jgi:hypothetical protein
MSESADCRTLEDERWLSGITYNSDIAEVAALPGNTSLLIKADRRDWL